LVELKFNPFLLWLRWATCVRCGSDEDAKGGWGWSRTGNTIWFHTGLR